MSHLDHFNDAFLMEKSGQCIIKWPLFGPQEKKKVK